MVDQWFKKDLQNIYNKHRVAVFIDESGDAEFLLHTVEHEFTIHQANSEIEELHVKYLIEREQHSTRKFLIYTSTAREKLKFVREYCETNGCLEIRDLQSYIRNKVHQTLNLNINLQPEDLVAAAKVSIGRDKTYWMDLCHKGAGEIFDLNRELLPFLNDPEGYSHKYDAQLLDVFNRKVNELLDQDYITKPAKTLANEVVKRMLDDVLTNSSQGTLKQGYENWIDSVSYRKSFDQYLKAYSRPSGLDLWGVSSHHPLRSIDESWLKEIGKNYKNKDTLPKYLDKIQKRSKSRQAKTLGILFWSDILTLLEFDAKNIAYLNSFSECTDYYTKHFYKLDTAIRNLYTEFLNNRDLLEPFQELYKEYVAVFLEKWFIYFNDYQENQTGVLQNIINENSGKCAIIVGDGVSYEFAVQVSAQVGPYFKQTQQVILADLPSETENNMSRIYLADGQIESVHNKREKFIAAENPGIVIEFIKLDQVNNVARQSQFLICTYKDIDDMGEKLQQKALKYFPETIDFFAEKIDQLLASGYKKVYLITDHGFVLTGLLSEADKISVKLVGKGEKAERYIRTVEHQPALEKSFVELEKSYQGNNYLYVSRNLSPFKTPGVYGFSHGGASPQELVTPYFCWEHSDQSVKPLSVSISNKDELGNVSGEVFQVKLQAEKGSGDVFSAARKINLVFFSNKSQVNKSDVFSIESEMEVAKEYTFDGYESLEVHLNDAVTKQLIDKATIRQNKDRDLGGLI